jgi:hypothetical protein
MNDFSNPNDLHDDDAPSGSTIAWLFWSLLVGFTAVLLLLFICGCAVTDNGIRSVTSTVVGLEVSSVSEGNAPSVRIGLIRHELVLCSSNAVSQAQLIKQTTTEDAGWMKRRVNTSLSVGSTAVTQRSVAEPMPSVTTTNR